MDFMIFACPKSGTTWLQRLLSSHPQVHCAESRPFGDYFDPRIGGTVHLSVEKFVGFLMSYYSPFDPRFNGEKFKSDTTLSVLNNLKEEARRLTGKSIYGEKLTPFPGTARHCIRKIRDCWPEVKFVHLTRQGRDVIASGGAHHLNIRLAKAEGDARADFEARLSERRMPDDIFRHFLGLWVEVVGAGFEAESLFDNYLHVTYESWVEDPMTRARQLFEFINADVGSGLVERCVEAASFKALSGGRMPGDEDRMSFFRKAVVGDGQFWLTPEQEKQFEEEAGPTVRLFDMHSRR